MYCSFWAKGCRNPPGQHWRNSLSDCDRKGKKSSPSSSNLPWTSLIFFFFYIWSSTSDSRLASWYGNRRKKKQSTINLTAAKWRKQETWRKYQACCRSHKGILGMVTYSGGKFLSQHPFTLLEQPAALEGNKVETVVEYKSPGKHL